MKCFARLLSVTSLLVALLACNSRPLPQQQFNPVSTQLATVPAGYEAGDVRFDHEGYQVATIEMKDGKSAVRINTQSGTFYGEVREPVFRKGFKGAAYIAKEGAKERVVVDGEAGKQFDAVDKLMFSPDGRVFYTAKKENMWMLVSQNRESKPVNGFNGDPIISEVGKKIVIGAQDTQNKKQFIMLCSDNLKKCSQGNRYDKISDLRYDRQQTKLAYIATKGGKKSLVSLNVQQGLAEKEGPWFDDVTAFALSMDGKHLAYLARRGDESLLVKDEIETVVSQSEVSLDVVVSNTGRVLHVDMLQGKVVVYLDGKLIGRDYGEVDGAIFSDDGQHYAYAAKKGEKHVIVVDGYEGPLLDMVVMPQFSPAGKLVVYRAREKGERFVMVVDDRGRTVREHPHYEAVWEVSFSPDGRFIGYGVKKGQELWWKVEPLE